jgi:hypothetical protein
MSLPPIAADFRDLISADFVDGKHKLICVTCGKEYSSNHIYTHIKKHHREQYHQQARKQHEDRLASAASGPPRGSGADSDARDDDNEPDDMDVDEPAHSARAGTSAAAAAAAAAALPGSRWLPASSEDDDALGLQHASDELEQADSSVEDDGSSEADDDSEGGGEAESSNDSDDAAAALGDSDAEDDAAEQEFDYYDFCDVVGFGGEDSDSEDHDSDEKASSEASSDGEAAAATAAGPAARGTAEFYRQHMHEPAYAGEQTSTLMSVLWIHMCRCIVETCGCCSCVGELSEHDAVQLQL